MSIIETVLIFVGIPALVVAVVIGLVFSGAARRGRRYRPGRLFVFRPVWFVAASDPLAGRGVDVSGALPGVGARAALAGGGAVAGAAGGSVGERVTGGASDRW